MILDKLTSFSTGYERLEYVYSLAFDADMREGFVAYSRYHMLCDEIARSTGCNTRHVCGVFAALSPNNDYIGNMRDTRTVCRAWLQEAKISDFKVSTYGQNKRKAWDIIHGIEPLELIVAKKTRNFFINVSEPKSSGAVTIDGHMANMWRGEKRPLQTRNKAKRAVAVTEKAYDEIANDVRALAHFTHLLPNQLQATLWLTWRRLHGITGTQLSFWDRDVEAAGLGFEKRWDT